MRKSQLFSPPLFVVGLLFSLVLLIKGQAQLPDSLLSQLTSAPTDSARFQRQLEIGKSYMELRDYKMADSLFESVIQWAREEKQYEQWVQALAILGRSKAFQNDIDESESYHRQSIELAQEYALVESEVFAVSQYAATLFDYRRPQEALPVLLQAKELIQSNEVAPGIRGDLFYNLAGIHMRMGQFPIAKEYLQETLRLWRQLEQWTFVADGLNGIGVLSKNMGQLDSAKHYYEQSLETHRANGEEEAAILFTPLHNLSTLAIQMGDLEESIRLGQEALLLAQEADNPIWQAAIYRELGDTYIRMEDLSQSRSLMEKSIALLSPLNRPRELAQTLTFYSKLEKQEGNYDKALEILEQSNELFGFDPEKNPIPYCSFLDNRAGIHLESGAYDLALEDIRSGLVVAKHNQFPLWEISFTTGIARSFLGKNELDSARHYAEQGILLGDEYGYPLEKQPSYQVLFDVLPKMNDFQAAFERSREYQELSDSIFKADLSAQVSKERVRQNIASAQEKQALAEKEAALLASRNNLFVGLLIALGIILVGGVVVYQRLNSNKQKIESQNSELTLLNQTKDKFFGIIAHDLRSPLVAFQGLGKQMNHHVRKGSVDKIQLLAGKVDELSDRLNRLLDNLLNWALLQTGTIPYHPKELPVEELVLDLLDVFQPIATAKQIDLKANIAPVLSVFADENALQAILRNLLSNALKFTQVGGTITVKAESKADQIFFTVQDTGIGISKEKLAKLFTLDKGSEAGTAGEKGTGLGLILSKELVEMNKGRIDIQSEHGKGSTISFSLPSSI